MKLQHYIFAMVLVWGAAACQRGFLDIKPKGQMIPETTDDFRKILDFVSNKNSVGQKTAVLVTYGIVNLLADDYQVGDSTQYNAMLATDRALWYHWGREGSYPPDLDDPDWRALYGQIYIMNSVIAGIPNARGPETEKNKLLAEAKFHRAFCYLGLVNIYARHYHPSTASEDPGVPLRLTVSLTEPLDRATVQETYDQILSDLDGLVNDLDANEGIYNHRPTQAAVYALLARTYLYMGDYENALDFADKSLQINDFLYDFNSVLILDPNLENYGRFADLTHRTWDDQEILIQKETAYITALYHPTYIPIDMSTVWSVYDTINDLRFTNYFSENGPATYRFVGNINRWQDAFYYPQVGLTIPEMYLTRAECLVRTGNIPAGIADLNKLRAHRLISSGFVPYQASNYNQAQALSLVKEERRRELMMRGVRWFDLRRYNTLDNANITITRHFSGEQLSPGDDAWVMPIAPLYIDQNPEIIPN